MSMALSLALMSLESFIPACKDAHFLPVSRQAAAKNAGRFPEILPKFPAKPSNVWGKTFQCFSKSSMNFSLHDY